MIRSLCLNAGYENETQYAPLLVHNTVGFKTISEFLIEFSKLLEQGGRILSEGHWWSAGTGLQLLQGMTFEETGSDFDKLLTQGNWVIGNPNLGPWIMIYKAFNAINDGRDYLIFHPDGEEEEYPADML